jgi:hypothetical protein
VGDGLGEGEGDGEGDGEGVGLVLSFRPTLEPQEQPLSLTSLTLSEYARDARAEDRCGPVTFVPLQPLTARPTTLNSTRAGDRNGRDMGNLHKKAAG